MARLAIRLFGSMQVSLDGKPIDGFVSDKVRGLLAYLAVSPDQPQRREKLAGLLWPEFPDRSARTSLRNALANLRRVIGDKNTSPPFLIISRQAIQFNKKSDCWMDVADFFSANSASPSNLEVLQAAVELYQGEFLEGFFIADSNAFEDWSLMKRGHYQRQMVEILHSVIEICEIQGNYTVGLPYAWRLVEMEPWEEIGQRMLMRLLALSGRRSDALTQFEKSRRVLYDELGVEPSPETVNLYKNIQSGEFLKSIEFPIEAEREMGSSLPYSPSTPIVNLPTVPSPFIGREGELAVLEEILADPDVRLVSIVGPGGIGKTRLAVETGGKISREKHTLKDGIVFVELAALSSEDQIFPAIAKALKLPLEEGEKQLLDYLKSKKILLILDNFENLLGGANQVAEILQSAPGVQVLVTSRERLQLRDERVVLLQGLIYPSQEIDPTVSTDVDAFLDEFSSARLFLQTAHRFQPRLVISSKDLPILSGICRLVEGMPLALELAASWMDTLSLGDIFSEIQVSNDILRTEWSDIPPRQRSIRAVFDSSYTRLNQQEQRALVRLSVFRGGFTRDAARFVAKRAVEKNDFLILLSRLVRKSFLRFDPTQNRYRVHELLRQFGSAKLSDDSTHEARIRDRHSRYFCDWLVGRDGDFRSLRQNSVIEEIKQESENLRTAFIWAAANKKVSRLLPAINPLGYYYQLSGEFKFGKITFQQIEEHLADFDHFPPSEVESTQQVLARLIIWESIYSGILGDEMESKMLAVESLELLAGLDSTGLDTRFERAQAFYELGWQQLNKNPTAAKQHFSRSRDLYLETGNRWGMVYALGGLGRANLNMCAYQEAQHVMNQRLEISQDIGHQIGHSDSLKMLGNISLVHGQWDEAVRLIRGGLAITPEFNPIGIAAGLCFLGNALACSGEFIEAEKHMSEGLSVYQELGTRKEALFHTLGLDWINFHLGKYQGIKERVLSALDLAGQLDHKRAIVVAHENLGMLALVENNYEEAQERFQDSITVFREFVSGAEEGGKQACLGLARRGLDYKKKARKDLKAGLRWALEKRHFYSLVNALSGIALMLADEGECERALELYTLALKQPFIAHSCWVEDIAGGKIAAMTANLPPQVAKAARARGEALDLWQRARGLLDELHE